MDDDHPVLARTLCPRDPRVDRLITEPVPDHDERISDREGLVEAEVLIGVDANSVLEDLVECASEDQRPPPAGYSRS